MGLRYNICIAWFLDIRISFLSLPLLVGTSKIFFQIFELFFLAILFKQTHTPLAGVHLVSYVFCVGCWYTCLYVFLCICVPPPYAINN